MPSPPPQTNLTWLDLSFNSIFRIEGLETLTKLTDLSLYHNQIATIENLDTLTNLQAGNCNPSVAVLFLKAAVQAGRRCRELCCYLATLANLQAGRRPACFCRGHCRTCCLPEPEPPLTAMKCT